MPCFLVRVSEKVGLPNPREFIGVVVADTIDELNIIVDEFCDPGSCEYALLPGGMIYVEGKAPTVPLLASADEYEDGKLDVDLLKDATWSEDWANVVSGRAFHDGDAAWLSFDDLVALEGTEH